VIIWLLSASEVTVNDAVSVIVSPQVANEPARIKVRVLVEPDSDNRALELVTESANFFRRSHVQLDGDRAARTNIFVYDGLPAGDYDVRAVLVDQKGNPGAIAVARVKIRP
jgi:hypothetical protein